MSCENPVFIIGAPRSGTTLLRSLIDAHPNICCPTWETGLFEKLAMIVQGDIDPHLDKDPTLPISRADLLAWCRRCADDLMTELTGTSGKSRWAEKTPAHVFHIELIHKLYPQAQFLHIIRNGYEVVRSLQSMPWAPRQIRWSCHRWVESVKAGREAGRKLPAGRYTEVRYEQLTNDPEATVRLLCEFLGETFVPQMLAFHEPKNNSWGVASQPIKAKPVNKHPELSLLERFVFARTSASMLRELGYR